MNQIVRDTEQFMRSTVDGLSAHVCVIDSEGTILVTNHAWHVFARENDAVEASVCEGVCYYNALIPSSNDPAEIEEIKAFAEGVRSVLAGNLREFVREYPCHSLCEERWFICRANRFILNERCYAVISHENITARKKSELEQARHNKRLESLVRVSQNTSKNIMELFDTSLGEAIELTGSAVGVIYYHDESGDHVIMKAGGMNEYSEVPAGPRAEPDETAIRDELVSRAKPVIINNFEVEHPFSKLRSVGGFPFSRLLSVPLFDGERVVAVVAVADKKRNYDQTDLLQLTLLMESVWRIAGRIRDAEELQIAKLAAESASQAKGEFLANMSHEIRTPMNAVLGMAQLLDKEPLSPDQSAMVRQIRASGRTLLGIINDILDFSKLEAGRLKIDSQPFDLGALLRQLDNTQGAAARDKGLSWRIETPTEPIGYLTGDSLRLEQILLNLISNAIKFTDQGDIRVLIQLMESTDKTVRLGCEVSDTGIGIAPAAAADMFKPFSQADGSIARRFGGTGLGLSICRRLVDLMGGTIGVESKEGKGSAFRFELPFGRAVATAPMAISSLQPLSHYESRLAGRCILVADDNNINLKLLVRALAKEGAVTTPAYDGRQALDLLREQPRSVDAVLMDIQMPVMDGLAATRAIRQDLGLTELPIIAVSAGVLSEERRQAFDAGVNDFLHKPVDLEIMLAMLLKWLPPLAPADVPLDPPTSKRPASGPPVQDTVPPERFPGLDFAQGIARLDGDEKFYRQMIVEFAQIHGDDATGIRREVAAGNITQAARMAHALKGVAVTLAAVTVHRIAAELESALSHDHVDLVDQLLSRLAEALAELRGVALLVNDEPQTPEILHSPDPIEVIPLLEELKRMITQRRLAALDLMARIGKQLAGTTVAPEAALLAAAVDRLDFAIAHTLACSLTDRLAATTSDHATELKQ